MTPAAKQLGDRPASEMTIRQSIAAQIMAEKYASIASGAGESADYIANESVDLTDALLERLADEGGEVFRPIYWRHRNLQNLRWRWDGRKMWGENYNGFHVAESFQSIQDMDGDENFERFDPATDLPVEKGGGR